jgi:hypothetical protein
MAHPTIELVKRAFTFAALLFLACSSSKPDSEKYSTHVETTGEDAFVVRITSITSMSAEGLKRALFTEAARATIDRGRIYLRVDELRAGSAMNVEGRTGADPTAPPSSPTSYDPSYRSEVSLSRQREGSIRFTIFRERPTGERVHDASQLLDQIKRGELPR